ncbi:MAG: hypothetical protein R6U32_03310 [Candidatus Woesearchaeota archaeon]
MSLEILTAQELYQRGEIDEFEVQDPHLFGDRRVMKFSDQEEGLNFAYAFVHQYLVPKYGREEAAKFPMAKTGPARKDLLVESLGTVPEPSPNPVWFAIPEDRFPEVEEFLKQYNPE